MRRHVQCIAAFLNPPVTLRQGSVSSVAPKAFRAALVRFAPQFKGYSQQDSQEVRPCSAGTLVSPI